MTLENSLTRVWFCCRPSIVVSEAFDFIDVGFFSAFLKLALNRDMLGWNTIRSLKI
jgi:hypothetical protein